MAAQPDATRISHFVFDVETIVDGALVKDVNYPETSLSSEEAFQRFTRERIETTGSDFIPYNYHIPVSLVVGKVSTNLRLVDLVAIGEPDNVPHFIARDFWKGWEAYGCPTLVTFNGRNFDLPVLELAAFRYGINLKTWLRPKGKSFDQPRNRYNVHAHLDLMEFLTNFSARSFYGGLNLAASLLGKPGKMDVHGVQVQDMYNDGRLKEINDYCRCDVLDTYFVFLRSRVLTGEISLDEENRIVAETKRWLEERRESNDGIKKYLDNWGDWRNPWTDGNALANSGDANDQQRRNVPVVDQ